MRSSSATLLLSFLSTVATVLGHPAPVARQNAPTHLVYEFELGLGLNNLAVRSSGPLLVTDSTNAKLWQVDPLAAQPSPVEVWQFTDADEALGITEVEPDVFYVVTRQVAYSSIGKVLGDHRISRVSFPDKGSALGAKVEPIATLPKDSTINGLTALDSHTILAADSALGKVWSVDTRTGAIEVVLVDTLMSPNLSGGASNKGINGLKVHTSASGARTLYFTNSSKGVLVKMDINADATARGSAAVVANLSANADLNDLVLRETGEMLVAEGFGNRVVQISQDGSSQKVIAGGQFSTTILEPTSLAFGRTAKDSKTLYVVTEGGLEEENSDVVGGQIVAFDMSK